MKLAKNEILKFLHGCLEVTHLLDNVYSLSMVHIKELPKVEVIIELDYFNSNWETNATKFIALMESYNKKLEGFQFNNSSKLLEYYRFQIIIKTD